MSVTAERIGEMVHKAGAGFVDNVHELVTFVRADLEKSNTFPRALAILERFESQADHACLLSLGKKVEIRYERDPKTKVESIVLTVPVRVKYARPASLLGFAFQERVSLANKSEQYRFLVQG